MEANPLKQLGRLGQSVWLDTLSRSMITTGKLKRLVVEDGLSGVTSNPTIFQKAISGSSDYDEALAELVSRGMTGAKELFLSLAVRDIADAADILMPVYKETRGLDGFVSLEVSPDLAEDTEATVREARELFGALGRSNVLIKVPATKAGLPAIERLTAEGVNVNVTLLFSVTRYLEVAEAYINGIERRIQSGEPVGHVVSVASFFVSRVDTLTDKLLSEAGDPEAAGRLMGRAAVANAKLAYREYKRIFHGERFKAARNKGANVQRLLWGSSGTKNPDYSDIKYIEELVAPETVNTMPEKTMDAFRDHGRPRVTIEDSIDGAMRLFEDLSDIGIDIEDVAYRLEVDGVRLFSESFFQLLDEISAKKDALMK